MSAWRSSLAASIISPFNLGIAAAAPRARTCRHTCIVEERERRAGRRGGRWFLPIGALVRRGSVPARRPTTTTTTPNNRNTIVHRRTPRRVEANTHHHATTESDTRATPADRGVWMTSRVATIARTSRGGSGEHAIMASVGIGVSGGTITRDAPLPPRAASASSRRRDRGVSDDITRDAPLPPRAATARTRRRRAQSTRARPEPDTAMLISWRCQRQRQSRTREARENRPTKQNEIDRMTRLHTL